MSAAALATARARLAALWPAASDRSGDPHPVAEDDLPAFRVTLDLAAAEPVAMGAALHRSEGTLSAVLMVRTAPGLDLSDALHRAADAGVAAILGGGDLLGGAVRALSPAARSVDGAQGEGRLATLTLDFGVILDGPDPAADGTPAGLGLA